MTAIASGGQWWAEEVSIQRPGIAAIRSSETVGSQWWAEEVSIQRPGIAAIRSSETVGSQ
jgi:hypothetical protein